MKAGFSKIDITPDVSRQDVYGLGFWYQRAVHFTGVRDPLFVRAAAVQADSRLVFIVSIDAIFDTYDFSISATDILCQRFRISPENIFITCTHAHSTPLIGLNGIESDMAGYGPFVESAIVRAASEAFESLQSSTVSIACDSAANVVRNRRPVLKTGKVPELHVSLDSDSVANWGDVNETMTLLLFRNAKGELHGGFCHYGIHGVCVQTSELISSDAMGRAIQAVERQVSTAVLLHLNGASGDIDPVHMDSEEALEATESRLTAVMNSMLKKSFLPLRLRGSVSRAGDFFVQRRGTPALEFLEEKIRSFPPETDATLRHHSGRGYEKFLLGELLRLSRQPERIPIHWQILNLNPILLVGVGGELFTRFGLELQNACPEKIVLPVGITREWIGYLPFAESFEQGGYETTPSRWSRIEPGGTEALLQHLIQMLQSLE